MNKFVFPAAIVCAASLVSLPTYAESMLGNSPYLSTAVISSAGSLASSVIISGIILSPILVPATLVAISVDKSTKEKEVTTITGKTTKNEDVTLLVATEKLKKNPVKPGDQLTIEPAEKGAGAYLKKEGKIISHMVTQDDRELTHQEKMP